MTSTELTKNILQDLQNVKENLMGLSDNIWLDIEHNNNERLKEGVEFKLHYNDLMAQFNQLSTDISAAISQYADIVIDEPPISNPNIGDPEQERIIEELDRTQPHYLNEDFTYKRPCAVKIFDKWSIRNMNTWKAITLAVSRYFYNANKEKFLSIIDNELFMGRDGQNSFFSYNKNSLRSPAEIRESLYIETNRSANDLIKTIKKILIALDISEDNILVYLREDRDA